MSPETRYWLLALRDLVIVVLIALAVGWLVLSFVALVGRLLGTG